MSSANHIDNDIRKEVRRRRAMASETPAVAVALDEWKTAQEQETLRKAKEVQEFNRQ